jgi:hypothetical protein
VNTVVVSKPGKIKPITNVASVLNPVNALPITNVPITNVPITNETQLIPEAFNGEMALLPSTVLETTAL